MPSPASQLFRPEFVDNVTIVHTGGSLLESGERSIILEDVQGHRRLVLDLFDVQSHSVGSESLGKLVLLYRKLTDLGGGLKVCDMPRELMEGLPITGLDEVLPNYEDEQAALDSF